MIKLQKPATKKAKTSMKINIGWLHFDQSRNKYQQVKLKTGGDQEAERWKCAFHHHTKKY